MALLYRALARAIAGVTSPATQHNEAVSYLEQAEQLPDPGDTWVIWQKQGKDYLIARGQNRARGVPAAPPGHCAPAGFLQPP